VLLTLIVEIPIQTIDHITQDHRQDPHLVHPDHLAAILRAVHPVQAAQVDHPAREVILRADHPAQVVAQAAVLVAVQPDHQVEDLPEVHDDKRNL